nr:WYL domain-containing protein [Kineosporia rhizophila]
MAGLEPRIRTAEPAFGPLYAATRDRQAVTFTYRKPNGEAAVREVEPWSVASRNGRWYLIGRDRGRGASRVFRLSRIESDVKRRGRAGTYEIPEDLDAQSMIGKHVPPADDRIATVLLRAGRGAGVRRASVASIPAADRPGWDELQIRIGDAGMLAQSLAGLGPDAVAVQPADLRAEVVRLLRGAAAAQAGARTDLTAGQVRVG